MGQTLLLSEQDVRALLPMEDVVAAVEKTFQGMGDGTVVNPSKVNLDLGESAAYPPYHGFMNAMPGLCGLCRCGRAEVGRRQSGGAEEAEHPLLLLPHHAGEPPHQQLYLRAGRSPDHQHAHRRPDRRGPEVSLQPRQQPAPPHPPGHLWGGDAGPHADPAIATLFDIEELRIYDVSRPALERFQADMQDVVPGKIILCDDPSQAAQGDAVICVTQSKDEFLKEEWLSPDTIVFPMGSYQECEDAVLLHADKIVVDHVEQTMHRGALSKLVSQGKLNESSITCTIGQLAAGKVQLERKPGERLVCIPIGTGAMDIGCASVVYQRALEQGRGQFFDFGVSSATQATQN